jgi:hypothetical protein
MTKRVPRAAADKAAEQAARRTALADKVFALKAGQTPDKATADEAGDQAKAPADQGKGPAEAEGEVQPSAAAVAGAGEVYARETRIQASNRWIREGCQWEVDRRRKDLIRQGRARGLMKDAAADAAWAQVMAEFPPPGVEPVPYVRLGPVQALAPAAAPEPVPAAVTGLADLPSEWPTMPANASLAAEVGWVQANRLRVVKGNTVDLSRALSPAPSHATLGWLETAISYPSKFADVALRATQNKDDETEQVKRERLSIDEIRALLAEMLDEPSPP